MHTVSLCSVIRHLCTILEFFIKVQSNTLSDLTKDSYLTRLVLLTGDAQERFSCNLISSVSVYWLKLGSVRRNKSRMSKHTLNKHLRNQFYCLIMQYARHFRLVWRIFILDWRPTKVVQNFCWASGGTTTVWHDEVEPWGLELNRRPPFCRTNTPLPSSRQRI